MKKYKFATILAIIITLSLTAVGAEAAYPAGSLLKNDSRAEVFLVDQNYELRWIPDANTFEALGYAWENIIIVPDAELLTYSFGSTLKATKTSSTNLPTLAESEAAVRELFADDPIMIDIAKCESGFRQFNDDGTILTSPNGLYVGVFQIDPKIHGDFANSMGMDVYTLEGNLAYAKYLKAQSGAKPWPACSQKTVNLTLILKLGMSNTQVKTVQQILNNNGFTLAQSGPGSVGNESDYFGQLTADAIKKFQCKKNIVCSGSQETTGYGMVGPKTRQALIQTALGY